MKEKSKKRIKAFIISLAFGVLIFFSIGLLFTQLLQKKIYFSLFVGIPAGISAGVVAFIVSYVVCRKHF